MMKGVKMESNDEVSNGQDGGSLKPKSTFARLGLLAIVVLVVVLLATGISVLNDSFDENNTISELRQQVTQKDDRIEELEGREETLSLLLEGVDIQLAVSDGSGNVIYVPVTSAELQQLNSQTPNSATTTTTQP